MSEHDRKNQLNKLQNVLDASESIAEKNNQIKSLQGKNQTGANMRKQGQLCMSYLE